ncbi:BlaI/MecI/CopY family transcriptional regulator [Actinophytocola sp.]|uniref:BlaI/MecI/CopY family transcriptional regulator n=1 Tax=Actinophytocola sp. TaxID=1872138 RepID=UPI00389A1B0D
MQGLGELEAAVMNVLWDAGEPLKVRDVLERLDTGKQLAYTTVMTVLDNLHRKQWVERERIGKAYVYEAAFGREDASAQALRDVLDSSQDPHAVLLRFVESVSDEETDLLRAALRKKRIRRR